MSCSICERIENAEANVKASFGYEEEREVTSDAIGTAYIEGFALGFMLRTEATYTEFCQKHADEMKTALLAAGAKPIAAARV